jgi:hypothetical protein
MPVTGTHGFDVEELEMSREAAKKIIDLPNVLDE